MKNGIAILVFVVLAVLALSFIKPPTYLTQKAVEQPAQTQTAPPAVVGTFTGTLPCADCAGITETITLTQTNAGSNGGVYALTSVYAEKGTFKTTGTWTTIKGDAKDQNAIVYELDPGTDHAMYYLKVDEDSIRQIATDLTEINSPFDQTLHRKIADNPHS